MRYSELLDTREIDGFTVKIFAEDEDMHPDELFDWECMDREQTLALMESQGLMGWFCACVKVYKNDIELSAEYLGGCSYSDVDDFLKSDYLPDMIDRALDQAKKALPELILKLSA